MKSASLIRMGVACAAPFCSSTFALPLEAIQQWAGAGTNRAAMVIHWTPPEVGNNTTVPHPIAEISLAWGFRWNGSATAEEMFNAIVAADPRLFVMASSTGASGKAIIGLGYDLNNNRVLGVRDGTNIVSAASFTNGIVAGEFSAADRWQALDPADLYWGGWLGPSWELWQELGGAGGFSAAPVRGAGAYWTPDDPAQPYSGNHGQWHYADFGLSGLDLKNGSWIGWSVAAGGLEFFNPEAPGTIAWGEHKHAPSVPEATPAFAAPFASAVVASHGPFGPAPYDDPASLVGMPATDFYDPFGEFSGATKTRRVKMVEPPYNYDASQTRKLITTLDEGSAVIVEFAKPITDNPANPYGIDLLVFGNSFYVSNGFANDEADMNTLTLGSGGFYEPVKVSVSPGFAGRPGEVAADASTWAWHRYETGPFGDTGFPTQGYEWDRANQRWTARPMDFTKPVNPALGARLEGGGLSAADAIDLYLGSGGGTGFDVAASGFSAIRYVKVEGISSDWAGGEIDAFAAARPMTLGESISVAPENVAQGTAEIYFQQPARPAENAVRLAFTAVNQATVIRAARLENLPALPASAGAVLAAIQLQAAPILGNEPLTLQAHLSLAIGTGYTGNGGDLEVFRREGAAWNAVPFTFEADQKVVSLQGLSQLSDYVVRQVFVPRLTVVRSGSGNYFEFTALAGWKHVLERTTDFVAWQEAASVSPVAAGLVTLQDASAPDSFAFYRLKLSRP